MLNSPFMQAGANKLASKSLLQTSKFSFSGVITNIEKTISTINQVVPLYNQVRPLINNSKTLINAFKSTNNKNKKRTATPTQKKDFDPNIIDASINTHTINETQNPNNEIIFESNDNPNKAFFV